MSLRVDLILRTEQRSGNVVSVRNLARVAPVIGPLIIASIGLVVALEAMNLRSQVGMAELLWQEAEPKKVKALKLRARAEENEAILYELRGWRAARLNWGTQLRSIQEVIRPETQLEGLLFSQTIQLSGDGKEKVPARVFTVLLSGRAAAVSAENDVQALTTQLKTGAAFTGVVESVTVPKFDADPQNKAYRIFQMECRFKPRMFSENSRK